MSENKKSKNGHQVNENNQVKVVCNFQQKTTVNENIDYNINKVTYDDLIKRIENKVKKVNENKELTADQKTSRIEKITLENEIKSLTNKVENAVIIMYILKKLNDTLVIENAENENFEINLDNKRLVGQTMLKDKFNLFSTVQDILLTGKCKEFSLIRNMKYILEITDKSVISYSHLTMKNFNTFSRADKEKIKNAKTLKFDNITIID